MGEILSSYSTLEIATFVLLLVSSFLLVLSVLLVFRISKILKFNKYVTKFWTFINVIIVFILIGYLIHALNVFNLVEMPIEPGLIINLVYFLGSIFAFMSINSANSLIKTILGDLVTDAKAYEVAIERIGIHEEKLVFLYDEFTIHCVKCEENISFTVADVVRQHYKRADKGINVESTFGVKSIILRPTHKCNEERREMITVHDSTLAYRSLDQSRIILGSTI